MRNESKGSGNKKAGPSAVDKAGGKQGMPKPRGAAKQSQPAPRPAKPTAPTGRDPVRGATPSPTRPGARPSYNMGGSSAGSKSQPGRRSSTPRSF